MLSFSSQSCCHIAAFQAPVLTSSMLYSLFRASLAPCAALSQTTTYLMCAESNRCAHLNTQMLASITFRVFTVLLYRKLWQMSEFDYTPFVHVFNPCWPMLAGYRLVSWIGVTMHQDLRWSTVYIVP